MRQADKVFLTLADGSQNTLENGGGYTDIDENCIDAVIFSKEDLTLNGSGALTISGGQAGHGVVSRTIWSSPAAPMPLPPPSHGLSGKDSVRITDGAFTITAGKDGIHAENADDAASGFLYILDGSFTVTADGDALSGEVYVQTDGGSFTLQSGGGHAAALAENVSAKGIKAAGDLFLNGGSYTIDAADDALHTSGALTLSGGTYAIAARRRWVHAMAPSPFRAVPSTSVKAAKALRARALTFWTETFACVQ